MEFLLEDIIKEAANQKLQTNTSKDLITDNSSFQNLPETNAEYSSDVIAAATGTDVDEKSSDTEKQLLSNTSSRRKSQWERSQYESSLHDKLSERQVTKRLNEKYKFFNQILLKFAKSTHVVTKVRNLRLYFLFVLLVGKLY